MNKNWIIERYQHQVGGHAHFMKPKNCSKVLKPLIENERRFYERLAHLGSSCAEEQVLDVLRGFLPLYYGTTELTIKQQSGSKKSSLVAAVSGDGTKLFPVGGCFRTSTNSSTITGQSLRSHSAEGFPRSQRLPGLGDGTLSDSPVATQRRKHCTKNAQSGRTTEGNALRVSTRKPSSLRRESCEREFTGSSQRLSPKNDAMANVLGGNSWNRNNQLTKLGCTGHISLHTTSSKHIVLEDLVYGFKKPNILDIKMGRRQWKPGASAEKERRQLEKSLSSTSFELGFRLCGWQWYDRKRDMTCTRDKYWGRRLKKDEIREAVCDWLSDGEIFQHNLARILLSKLDQLTECVAKVGHWRLFSSSLLFFYDGNELDAKKRESSLGVKMIDFANTVYQSECPGPDVDYLLGLKNLIVALSGLADRNAYRTKSLPGWYTVTDVASELGVDGNGSRPDPPFTNSEQTTAGGVGVVSNGPVNEEQAPVYNRTRSETGKSTSSRRACWSSRLESSSQERISRSLTNSRVTSSEQFTLKESVIKSYSRPMRNSKHSGNGFPECVTAPERHSATLTDAPVSSRKLQQGRSTPSRSRSVSEHADYSVTSHQLPQHSDETEDFVLPTHEFHRLIGGQWGPSHKLVIMSGVGSSRQNSWSCSDATTDSDEDDEGSPSFIISE